MPDEEHHLKTGRPVQGLAPKVMVLENSALSQQQGTRSPLSSGTAPIFPFAEANLRPSTVESWKGALG